MRIQDLVIGETYRHKDAPNVGYAKVLEKLKPEEGVNKNKFSVVKCEWTTSRDSSFGFIKYFKPSDLVK